MAIKNFWSLRDDEALVASKLQDELKHHDYEVFFPLRSQLKDIDLILCNLKNKKTFTIQVKGSRSYPAEKKETETFGEGESGWVMIKKKHIFDSSYPVDYFIFLIHLETQGITKKEIKLHYIVLPTEKLKEICLSKKPNKNDEYGFYFWINPKENKALEFHESRKKPIDLSRYLDNFDQFRH